MFYQLKRKQNAVILNAQYNKKMVSHPAKEGGRKVISKVQRVCACKNLVHDKVKMHAYIFVCLRIYLQAALKDFSSMFR